MGIEHLRPRCIHSPRLNELHLEKRRVAAPHVPRIHLDLEGDKHVAVERLRISDEHFAERVTPAIPHRDAMLVSPRAVFPRLFEPAMPAAVAPREGLEKKSKPIVAATALTDGRFVINTMDRVEIVDLDGQKSVRDVYGPKNPFRKLVALPNGGFVGLSAEGDTWAYDARGTFRHGVFSHNVVDVVANPAGDFVALSSTGRIVDGNLPSKEAVTNVHALAFLPDGRLVASVAGEGGPELAVRDAQGEGWTRLWASNDAKLRPVAGGLAINTAGEILLSCEGPNSSGGTLLTIADGATIHTERTPDKARVAASHNDFLVASNGALSVRDVLGETVHSIPLSRNQHFTARFDGAVTLSGATSAGDGYAKVWRKGPGHEVGPLGDGTKIVASGEIFAGPYWQSFSAVTLADGNFVVEDKMHGAIVKTDRHGRKLWAMRLVNVQDLLALPNGDFIAVGSTGARLVKSDGSVRDIPFPYQVKKVILRADGSVLASELVDSTGKCAVHVWDGKSVHELVPPRREIGSIADLGDGRLVITEHHGFAIVDPKTGAESKVDAGQPVLGLAARDGKFLLTLQDDTTQLWSAAGPRLLKTVTSGAGYNSIAAVPSGWIIGDTNGVLRTYDVDGALLDTQKFAKRIKSLHADSKNQVTVVFDDHERKSHAAQWTIEKRSR